MVYGRNNDDVIDDVTWPWKVKVVTWLSLRPVISKTAWDIDLVTTGHWAPLGSGMVTWPMTSFDPERWSRDRVIFGWREAWYQLSINRKWPMADRMMTSSMTSGQCRDPDNFWVYYLEHGLRCRLDSVAMGHLQEIIKTANINVNKKAVLSQRWQRDAPYKELPVSILTTQSDNTHMVSC